MTTRYTVCSIPHMHLHILLYTTLVHNKAQNSSDNLPSYRIIQIITNLILCYISVKNLAHRRVVNFVCTVKFADPENPMFCARIGDISPLQEKL